MANDTERIKMTDLDLIKSSVDLQMSLSKLLFEKLGMGCWHEEVLVPVGFGAVMHCKHCDYSNRDGRSPEKENPNLFHDGNGFFKVWEACKDRGGWWDTFVWDRLHGAARVRFDLIATPSFQYEVAKWLCPKEVEEITGKYKEDDKARTAHHALTGD